jgi:3-phenylpropionate/cinnamic acid dioxygenase small subunit
MKISVEQKLAIHELLARAAFAYDERDMIMLETSFSKQASFSMRIGGGDVVGPFEGRDAIMGLMTGSMNDQTDIRRHVISNIFFDDKKPATTVISNLTLMATDKGDIQLLTSGVYYDTVVEEDGRWCIGKRHIDLDKAY